MLDTEESRVPYIIIYIRLQYSNNSSLKALINSNLINEEEKGLNDWNFRVQRKKVI